MGRPMRLMTMVAETHQARHPGRSPAPYACDASVSRAVDIPTRARHILNVSSQLVCLSRDGEELQRPLSKSRTGLYGCLDGKSFGN